jgi:hypothetical protein
MELVAANAMITRLWEIDLDKEFTGPGERSLITAATNPRFSDRCVSWEQTVGAMASRFKSHHRGPEDPSAPGPYFAHIVEVLASYDPAYLTRVTGLWAAVEPAEPAVRWTYPVVWRHPDVGDMRFTGVVNCASETDGLAFNDWIPVDAATWTALERLKSIPFTSPSSAVAPAPAAGD